MDVFWLKAKANLIIKAPITAEADILIFIVIFPGK